MAVLHAMALRSPRLVLVAAALLLSAACSTALGTDEPTVEAASVESAPPKAVPSSPGDADEPAPSFLPVEDAGGAALDASDASDANAEAPPYTCTDPPAACELSCDTPTCALVCDPDRPTSCRYECSTPHCACASAPAIACDLARPVAICDVKCEKPNCAIVCPPCTEGPCEPCRAECAPVHCVTHCQAPRVDVDGGTHRVVHCQAPRPSCAASCDGPPECFWNEDGDGGYTATCEPIRCATRCAPIPPATCQIRGCDEACDEPTDCRQTCDPPVCTVDGGTVECDPPSHCTTTCNGGLCHVTSCF